MKKINAKNCEEIFNEYLLTVDEMISVKGGDAGEPILKPSVPPIKI
ncbi:MAG TPA: hypothetical protein PK816_16300 [Candidatus Cloacimonadota bacterium]|nr:hypothetical protein [Bacteroidales bacterium]HPM03722.1 hypothetical protein [Candidatus Cloacimonadota bacterium]